MCDTMVVVRAGSVLFAKNSDRDANEAQVLDWQPAREHPEGAELKCTWISIPQVRRTHAVLLSRPFWIWGAEIGANEHGVAIGNEAVFTRVPYAKVGLTGMDMLRLALERAATAEEAVEVIRALLAAYGQGGGCGLEKRSFTYHNSFLVADPRGAFVVETAGRELATERVSEGVRSISNGLTIPGFANRHADKLMGWAAECAVRREITQQGATRAQAPEDLMAVLRSHGARTSPRYGFLTGSLNAPCAHGGGTAAGSVTTASWVSELREGGSRHWATGTSSPCMGLFKPVAVNEPVDLGPAPQDKADGSLWWSHERLHRLVLRDPERLLPLFAAERDEVERKWRGSPPESGDAFAEAKELLAWWMKRVEEAARGGRDVRPFWARRYWSKRERAAGAPASS